MQKGKRNLFSKAENLTVGQSSGCVGRESKNPRRGVDEPEVGPGLLQAHAPGQVAHRAR